MQKTSRASGIHYKSGSNRNRQTISCPTQSYFIPLIDKAVQFDLIDVLYPHILRFVNEKLIEVRTKPMGIRNSIMGTGGYKELPQTIRIGRGGASELMMIESETSLQATGNVWIGLLPTAPLG